MTESRRWREPTPHHVRRKSVTGFRIVDEILARRVVASGVSNGNLTDRETESWLNPSLADLVRSASVPGMEDVVERIGAALNSSERIVVFGDYDCDGVTSTAILVSALRSAHPNPDCITWRLPSREDGYGLRRSHLDSLTMGGKGLLVAVDCGSNDVEEIAAIRARGMDVVVIDHHQITAELPADVPLANPQREPEQNSTQLTGAGLAWLVVCALARNGFQIAHDGADEHLYLDLAAIGTVGDVGQLTGINRALVRDGTVQLRETKRWGLRGLSRAAQVDLNTITAENVSFKIVPRLNAPGRIDKADPAVQLLLATDFDEAQEISATLVELDGQRRAETGQILMDVECRLALEDPIDPVIIMADENWRHGLLGPVASKLSEKYGRPVILLSQSGDDLVGSGRSIAGWDIGGALNDLDNLLIAHGGHLQAAGLTLKQSRLEEFRVAINESMRASGLTVPVIPEYEIDADIFDEDVSLGLGIMMEKLAPFGAGNPRPILRWTGVEIVECKAVGSDATHAQLQLMRKGKRVRAIMFGGAARMESVDRSIPHDVLLKVMVEPYRGKASLSVQIVDLQPSEP